MARRSTLRAADTDREAVAERLRQACAEGRLLAEELEERLGAAFSARTYGELDALVSDLPAERPVGSTPTPTQVRAWVLPAAALAIALAGLLVIVALAVVFFLSGVFAVWVFWAGMGWWLYGRRRPGHMTHYRRAIPPGGPWDHPARGAYRRGARL